MPMSDEERLVSLGVPYPLAQELLRMMAARIGGTPSEFQDHEARISALEQSAGQFITQD